MKKEFKFGKLCVGVRIHFENTRARERLNNLEKTEVFLFNY